MLWAVGMVIALVAIGLLVGKLYPSIWEALSRERVASLIGIGVALTVIGVLLALGGASLGWTGFGDKKLWDWLQLLSALAIPIVLAVAGFWFTTQQDARQQRIEGQRAQAERELAEQRAQDEALQTYLDQMSMLLLEKKLRNSDEDSEVRTLARARTLTILERVDPDRRSAVLQFLERISKPSYRASRRTSLWSELGNNPRNAWLCASTVAYHVEVLKCALTGSLLGRDIRPRIAPNRFTRSP